MIHSGPERTKAPMRGLLRSRRVEEAINSAPAPERR